MKSNHVAKSENVAINMVKMWAPLKGVTPAQVYDVLHDPNYRAVWDNNMAEGTYSILFVVQLSINVFFVC